MMGPGEPAPGASATAFFETLAARERGVELGSPSLRPRLPHVFEDAEPPPQAPDETPPAPPSAATPAEPVVSRASSTPAAASAREASRREPVDLAASSVMARAAPPSARPEAPAGPPPPVPRQADPDAPPRRARSPETSLAAARDAAVQLGWKPPPELTADFASPPPAVAAAIARRSPAGVAPAAPPGRAGSSSALAPAAPETIIEISIGRIDVRAAPAAVAPPPRRSGEAAPDRLAVYLDRRSRGSRS